VLGGQEPRQRSWTQWGGRRWLKFSLAVAIPFAVSTVLWELAAPRWAGDRIGLSFGACLFYLVADLIWVATLNVVYALVWVSETLINPSRRENYRRWAYPIVVAIGAGSGPAWIASVVVAGWLRRP
jgi:hypothetical protein